MGSSRGDGRNRVIKVDPNTFEQLDAEWGQVSRWTQVLWVLERLRHQAAIVGCAAIVIILQLAGVRAADTLILSIAIICIATIAIMAIFSEWIGSKKHGQSREREAAPQYAAKD